MGTFRDNTKIKTKLVSVIYIIMDLVQYFTILFVLYISGADSLMFYLEPMAKKCLKEEIHKDVPDTRGHTLYKKEDVSKGKFAFTTDEYDMFEVCFETVKGHGQAREVKLDMKHGVEARNYDDIAKAEKLKPMELELRRLEDLSEAIVNDFAYMRAREEEMRDTNEPTNSRVFYFSIFSMICLLGLACAQVLYLKKYFKSKKLIE